MAIQNVCDTILASSFQFFSMSDPPTPTLKCHITLMATFVNCALSELGLNKIEIPSFIV